MARRSIDWNSGLSKDLRNVEFAQGFIQNGMDDGLPLKVILAKVIRAYGVKEFAAKVKMPSSNVVRAIDPEGNPTSETLNQLLRPFKMELSAAPVTRRVRA